MTGSGARAEFDAALELARTGRIAEAQLGFERAAAAGDGEAMLVLADLGLRGGGVPRDPVAAIGWLEQAAGLGVPAAARSLAAVHFSGHGVPADDRLALQWFHRALAAGHLPAIRDLGLLLWVSGGSLRASAAAVLRHAARGGDAYARHVLGRIGAPAPEQVAADADARVFEQAGADFEWPRTPAPDAEPLRPRARMVWTQDRLLDPLQCAYLMVTASPWLDRSRTNDPATGQPVPDQARTSWGMNFAQAFPDLVVADAERRIAGCAGLPLSHAEPLAVLRYEVGQEYRPHFDYMAPEALAKHPFYAQVGQRTLTVVTYLNAPRGGGGTEFPHLQLRIEPVPGTALRFLNTQADGTPEPDSLHAGLPVTQGEKWVCTLWFRERETRSHVYGASRESMSA